ncbi:MAG: hypothetical protein AB7U73_01935 [Pirellulales bacterium]
MANEINFRGVSGATHYFHVQKANGQVWSTVGAAFENPTAANWGNYDIAAAEFSTTGYFSGAMPAVPAGDYTIVPFQQAGGSPATTDQNLAGGTIKWSGSAELFFATQIDVATGVIAGYIDTEIAAIVGYLDTEIAAILAKVVNLPASPAAVGSAMTLTTAYDSYYAKPKFTRDQTNSLDEYVVPWFKNAVPLFAGITVPTIRVAKFVDGTDLIAQTAMTEIGSLGIFKYSTSSARLTKGEMGILIVAATIDGQTRTHVEVVGRDSP